MALNRSDKSRILRRYFPGMTRNSEMSTEPSTTVALLLSVAIIDVGSGFVALWPDVFVSSGTRTARNRQSGLESI